MVQFFNQSVFYRKYNLTNTISSVTPTSELWSNIWCS